MSFVAAADHVRIEGDESGFHWARKQLPAAPSTTRMMRLAFRIRSTVPDTSTRTWIRAWNHTQLFGLSFDPDIPEYNSGHSVSTPYRPDRFFGWITESPPGTTNQCGIVNTRTGFGWDGTDLMRLVDGETAPQRHVFMNGVGGVGGATANLTSIDNNGSLTSQNGQERTADSLPLYVASDGKGLYNYGWEIRSSIVDKTMTAVLVIQGYNEAVTTDLFDVFGNYYDNPTSSPNLVRVTFNIHGNVTSHFRLNDSTWVWPRWLMMRYSLPLYHFRLDSYRWRYYQEGDSEL